MAADSTTDDTKENGQNGDADFITGSSNDTPFTDLNVDKQPSQVDSKDIPSSQSKGTERENVTSLHLGLEAMKDEQEMLPRCDNGDSSAAISIEKPDKLDILSIGIQSKGRGDGTGEKDSTQSPAATLAFAAESDVQKLDGTDLNDSNSHDSFTEKERSLEVKAKHEKNEQQKDGVTAIDLSVRSGTKKMEMSNGSTPMESFSLVGAEEGKSMSVLKESGSFSNNETKEKIFCKEMPGLELATENVTNKKLGEVEPTHEVEEEFVNPEHNALPEKEMKTAVNMFLQDKNVDLENESETEENQAAFMKELEAFHKERCLEFKPPKFYGEPLNCLKLWRAVIKLGGYEQVTACKLWRQVGESFNPPKTCTTVSWTFRGFYEKALLEYEKHKMRSGELPFTDASFVESSGTGNQAGLSQASGSGRARRDAAARAMQGWHSQRVIGSGEVGDPIIKDKTSISTPKREKQLKTVGLLKRKKLSPVDHSLQVAHLKASKPQLETMVVDIGPQADWVKINVQRTKDCFEVYALVPGLLREEVRVQSDPAGRLVISGQPEQVDNPWGVTPFKKVVSLPSRIDPHQTSAVVTLHGQLFVRVPFEQPEM